MTLALVVQEKNLRSVMETRILKLGKYKHYKGKEYEVIALAKHSESLEDVVVYRALYGDNQVWVRPLKMFLEQTEIEGKSVPRFSSCG